MRHYSNVIIAYSIMLILILAVGVAQSWGVLLLSILNLCLISAVMSIGAKHSMGLCRINKFWGYGLYWP